ncbi:MAG TPA: cytochrome c [Steroidobacteraceae bacterium]|nr:cytochrome c [Steroidobacteraceae bacterium]
MDFNAGFKGGVIAALLAALAVPALAQAGAHERAIERGHHIAANQCAACHVVVPGRHTEPLLSPPAPAFVDIANRPGTTAQSLSKFVRTTHWDLQSLPMQMPTPELTPPEVNAVVQYILSLRAH